MWMCPRLHGSVYYLAVYQRCWRACGIRTKLDIHTVRPRESHVILGFRSKAIEVSNTSPPHLSHTNCCEADRRDTVCIRELAEGQNCSIYYRGGVYRNEGNGKREKVGEKVECIHDEITVYM